MFKHPLENPSLAPYGLTTPLSYQRLQYKPTTNPYWVNQEKLLAEMWDKCNRADAPRPLPVQTIIHEILPGQKRRNHLAQGNFVFEGKPYLTRDLMMLSSIVQWLGSNVGNCFLIRDISQKLGYSLEREFLTKYAEDSKIHDMVTFWCHICTPKCKEPTYFSLIGESNHRYNPRTVTDRDVAVVDGLLRWLGRPAGRGFLSRYEARRKRAWNMVDAQRQKARHTNAA